ncbi:MBL fold metallo-hydrolase [Leifsonia shinshuensis]|uniref:MBL fold metallo-hydrolase n=1 Tax=Leifsonia shinshuensis TaxID=150026 RepID=UPI0028584EAF|nr:MBL fold metallo-hydrolase [Leifsonia shinshuensis]MDR6970583.1 glyoxylase-like metal-dependent hydrolase (beta-lactamase superfamily II) [Leifsonia shinshuensis]
MELAPGLRRIGNDIIAVHLIVTDEGMTLIDTGLPGHYADLTRELAALGRPLSDIKGIVLTHGDSDHTGFAERLRSELGIPVYVGSGDAARAMGEKPPSPPKDRRRIGPVIGFFAYSIRKGGVKMPPVKEVVAVNDGDVLPLPGAPEIIGMPGHSPGSVAIHVPAVRAVFVGDELTTRSVLTGETGPQPAPFTDDQAGSSASLEKLAGLDVDFVIPGHGPAWTQGAPALIAAYREAEAARR